MNRARALLVGIIVALVCLGPIEAPAASADQAVGIGCTADAELKQGDTGPSVICLQYALGMIGLSTSPITGTYDADTAGLVTWFQATHPPLRVDGRAGPQTLTAMGIWSGKIAGVVEVQCVADATIRPNDI